MSALADAYFAWVLGRCSEGRMLVVDWNEFQPADKLLAAIKWALANPAALRYEMSGVQLAKDHETRRQQQNEVLASIAVQHAK